MKIEIKTQLCINDTNRTPFKTKIMKKKIN